MLLDVSVSPIKKNKQLKIQETYTFYSMDVHRYIQHNWHLKSKEKWL